MSEAQGAPTSANTNTPPVAPAATPPAVAPQGAPAPQAPPPGDDPSWLGPRLERAKAAERAALLAELGVTDPAAAKAAIEAAKKADEANKGAEQRAAEAATQLATEKQERERLFAATKGYADSVLKALDDTKRAAILEVAGDDPAAQLKAYNALSATWSAPAAAAPTAPANGAPAPTPPTPPANTAPPPNAPPAAGSSSPTDKRAVHEQLKAKNPVLAARFGLANPEVFEPKTS